MAEASSLTKQIDQNLLECGICLERYKNPRGLPCLHSFCHECLERWCKGKKQVACPICMKPTLIPEDGVSGFPTHFLVNKLQATLDMEKLRVKEENLEDTCCSNCNLGDKKATVYCLDCQELYCDTCHKSHNSLKLTKQHQLISVEQLRSGKVEIQAVLPQHCEEHGGETKSFFCENCNQLVCGDCIVMKKHCRDHNYLDLKAASKKYASKLSELTQQHRDLEKYYQEAIQKTQRTKEKLASGVKEANTKLDAIQKECMQQVKAKINKQKADIHRWKVDRMKKMNCIQEQLQIPLAIIQKACDLGTKVTQLDSDYDILSVYSTLSANLEELNKKDAVPADEGLGFVNAFIEQDNTNVQCVLKLETWLHIGQWSTKPSIECPSGIAVNPNGDTGVKGTFSRCVKVFTKDGHLKHTFKGCNDTHLDAIAITPYNGYIISGKEQILFYDSRGNNLPTTVATYDYHNKSSSPITLAVDVEGRIIAGLGGNTISIGMAMSYPSFPQLLNHTVLLLPPVKTLLWPSLITLY